MDKKGNLVTSVKGVEKLAIKHYTEVLKNRPMLDKYKGLKYDKEALCEERVKVAKENKSPPWKMNDLENILKFLETKKSRDSYGLANELFKPEIAGRDLKIALLAMMNN